MEPESKTRSLLLQGEEYVTWHHYDGEVPAGLRESSGHDWDEAVDLATTWFARGQRNN